MQGFQLSKEALHSIFIDQSLLNQKMIYQVVQWNQSLEPSFNVVKSVISNFLIQKNGQDQENVDLSKLKIAVRDVPKTLKLLYQLKCPKNFMRAYLAVIKCYFQQLKPQINMKAIIGEWQNIFVQLLDGYFSTFNLQVIPLPQPHPDSYKIPQQEITHKIQTLIDSKDYANALNLIKITGKQKNHIQSLLGKMASNKQASKAADYVKTLGLNPLDFPNIGQRLYKNTARHFLTRNGWEYAQQIFEDHHQALACVIEDLVFKGKFKEAISIWERHPACREFIAKEQTIKYFQTYKNKPEKDQILENYLSVDKFGPSSQKYLSFSQFNLTQDDIIFIDSENADFHKHLSDISCSKMIGIDTESIVGQTKFDKKSEIQEAALIQIATENKVYLFDGFKSDNQAIRTTIIDYIYKSKGLVIGHSLDNDLGSLLKSLGCTQNEIKQLKIEKIVDIWKLFKAIYPQKRYSNLAFISQTVLGKQICKQQTLTNWKRRPLRKNQIHYAAMDAYVCLKIYSKLLNEYGQQMIAYYTTMGGTEF